ncbi:phytanoyl-CoA dioxygenase family protein [Sorangium sp. So ce1389]|uniref:phytanoyl-CoA dioxygenase family protein n=1 Tax=Sorangium sp. So ce1389 TaxID=3133336 RepID=UPI003F60CAD2
MTFTDHAARRPPLGEQIRALEVEGFAVLPGLLDPAALAAARAGFARLEPMRTRFSDRQWFVPSVQWSGCAEVVALIAHPPALAFLRAALGDEIVCTNASYARTDPGYPGMPLHSDVQPYGSKLFGPIASVPVSVRVLYYLDDLTESRAPLRVVPSSHLSLHRDATPYRRHRSHPDEVVITCPAGTAVVLHGRLFHGVGANTSPESRAVYTIAYRPAWAGPARRVPPHEPEKLAGLPREVRALLASPNKRAADDRIPIAKGDDSASALGLGPSRWRRDGGRGAP